MNRLLPLAAASLCLGACDNMMDQERVETYEASALFEDQQSARPILPGTVPRGHARLDRSFYTGLQRPASDPHRLNASVASGQGNLASPVSYDRAAYVQQNPLDVTMEVLRRGQQQYLINCAPCHAPDGSGNGMIVQRGFPPPPSYHIDRLREDPPGRLFTVITNGYGNMYSYAERVKPRDRWAIVAYIGALQRSRRGTVEDLTEAQRADLLQEEAP